MKKLITLLLLVFIFPIITSFTTNYSLHKYNDPYPEEGFYHYCHIVNGGLVTKKKFVSVTFLSNGDKHITVYDCPPNMYFSCKVNRCVVIGDELNCGCNVEGE